MVQKRNHCLYYIQLSRFFKYAVLLIAYETIERIFGTANENHGFRYTQMYGKARMEMKVGLTYVCLNLKKLAKMLQKRGVISGLNRPFSVSFSAA